MATQLQRDLTQRPAAIETGNPSSQSRAGESRAGESRTGDGAAVLASGISRVFGDRAVLDGIDLRIEPGEFVALLGRSGSGKSTLLRALADLDPDVEGTILVPERRAVVFQEPRLLPWKRVEANVRLGLKTPDAKTAVARSLEEVGLADHQRAWPLTLSGGEAQRAALARALVRDPQLLLLDEPFGALDALTRIRMHALLQQLWARHEPAVLLVTHDVDEAILLADRILVLTDGHLSVDVAVDLPGPRVRSDHRFEHLRSILLAELGVDEEAEGDHRANHRTNHRADQPRPA